MNSIRKKTIVNIIFFLCCSVSILGQKVELLKQSTVTNEGLYFWYPNGKKAFDFAPNISPRGDCFTVSNGYIFFGWYRGGMNKRNLMISRKKIGSDKWVHIQLPHTNTLVNEKLKPTPYPNGLGNSHQTISVGISKKDNTIHIFYDHHNDPLNYIISKKGKAFVPDNEFKANIFQKTRENLATGEKIRITYPELTENSKGDLIVNYRVGTSHAGEETVHSYNGTWTRSKVISTGRPPKVPKNKSNYAYGTPVFANGQFYYTFSVRWDANRKAINEGIYLAKCGPNFTSEWEDLKGNKHKLPIKDFSPFLVDDPDTENNEGATSPVTIAVSDKGDVHLSYKGRGKNTKYFYSYVRKSNEKNFTKKSGFSKTGVAWKNRIYNVITSNKGIITIESTPVGSIDYRTDLRLDTKKAFGNSEARIVDGTIVVIVEDRKNRNTDKQPIYSYEFKIIDGSNPPSSQAPTVNITSPSNNASFELGQEIVLSAGASDADGDLEKVNFFINDEIVSSDNSRPFETTFTPTQEGTYTIVARAIDRENAKTDASVTITVVKSNAAPTVNISSPANNATFDLGQEISLSAAASDADGDLEKVNFFVNDVIVSSDNSRPFETTFTPTTAGTYNIVAKAIDKENAKTDASVTITVVEKNVAPIASFSTPVQNTIEQGYSELIITVDASDPNADSLTVLLKVNGKDVRSESVAPYQWGHTESPNPNETLGLTVGENVFEAIVTDDKGLSTTIAKTITVTAKNQAPTTSLSSPLQGDVYSVGEVIDLSALATDPDGNLDKVNFKVNDLFYETINQRPFKTTFTPTQVGTYKIAARAFDKEGLFVETFVTINVDATLSSEDFFKSKALQEVKLYPSPTSSLLNITGLTNENTQISIIDISGKIILNTVVNKNNAQISVAKFTNGIYFMKLNDNTTQKTMSFIKN